MFDFSPTNPSVTGPVAMWLKDGFACRFSHAWVGYIIGRCDEFGSCLKGFLTEFLLVFVGTKSVHVSFPIQFGQNILLLPPKAVMLENWQPELILKAHCMCQKLQAFSCFCFEMAIDLTSRNLWPMLSVSQFIRGTNQNMKNKGCIHLRTPNRF